MCLPISVCSENAHIPSLTAEDNYRFLFEYIETESSKKFFLTEALSGCINDEILIVNTKMWLLPLEDHNNTISFNIIAVRY